MRKITFRYMYLINKSIAFICTVPFFVSKKNFGYLKLQRKITFFSNVHASSSFIVIDV